MEKTFTRLYNGAAFCANCANCPVVDLMLEDGMVRLSDPAQPERGSFAMTAEEYNTLLKNAKSVE